MPQAREGSVKDLYRSAFVWSVAAVDGLSTSKTADELTIAWGHQARTARARTQREVREQPAPCARIR